MHGAATTITSLALVVIGLFMLVSTLARGGGPLAVGVILGLLFFALGAARLYVTWRSSADG
ncbi:MAG: hypothetical protein AVDCRST_MAG85-1335 [uncultured Solirubrobacteraceae bacterium]|uniref:Uncharacterized protein n=1 Tax=uncultured Solirubrobacteraceae bacterium TaxID=1162706 RepID=A0A6J4SAC9_9ACTN|nr:MAG: hypothetical protein AVDCRST_MAG85-1335 [uncultured Solirubrobacteraceae bacterium]